MDAGLALGLEEVGVDADRSWRKGLVVGLRECLVDGRLGHVREVGEDGHHDLGVAMGECRATGWHAGHGPAEDPDLGHRRGRGRGRGVLEDGVDRGVVERVEEQRAIGARARLLGVLEELVDAHVRHRHDELGHRRRDLAEGLDRGLTGFRVAVEDEHDRERRLAVQLRRDKRRRRGGHEE